MNKNTSSMYLYYLMTTFSQSWMQLCIMKGLVDEHADAIFSLESALSRGFHDFLRTCNIVH